jgi:hypothetical protein
MCAMHNTLVALVLLAASTLAVAQPATATGLEGKAAELDRVLAATPDQGLDELIAAARARWHDIRSFRARFVKQERHEGESELSPEEQIDYKFLKDHALFMVWDGEVDAGKKALFVEGKYEGEMAVYTKWTFFWVHTMIAPDDPRVLAQANHPVTEAGFGRALDNIQERVDAARRRNRFRAEYLGVKETGEGRRCLVVRGHFQGDPKLRTSTVWFDAEHFMPIIVRTEDARGLLERYEYRKLRLDPKIGGRPELTVKDFQRSKVFDDRSWRREREEWDFEDICEDAERLEREHTPTRHSR